MKKLILLFVAAGAGFSAMAQVRGGDNFFAQKYTVDLDFPVGVLLQSPTSSFPLNYTNVAYSNVDKVKMNAGISYGYDVEVGYFLGLQGKFGIGAGYQSMMQTSTVELGNFRVDYQSQDQKGHVFRQILSSVNPIKETLTINNSNIPVVLKYKKRFTTKIGLFIDAGILYNIQETNKWKSDATFNYEAAYKFTGNKSGAPTLYDNALNPGDADWLITAAMYGRTVTQGFMSVNGVFDSLRKSGYNVALGVKPTSPSGTINYTTGSIGFTFRPAISVRLKPRLHLKIGAFVNYQTFKNNTTGGYVLVDNMGTKYSSLLNTVSSTTATTMGLNLGLRYFFGIPKDKQFDGKYDE